MKQVKVRKRPSMPEKRDDFVMNLERCTCCGGIITCECTGCRIEWYCADPDPGMACEHVSPDSSCLLGGNCSEIEGGKLNTSEANHKMRAMISYACYEIFRILCQFGKCIATRSDEIMRALSELNELVEIHVYKDLEINVVHVVPAGSPENKHFKEKERGKFEKLA